MTKASAQDKCPICGFGSKQYHTNMCQLIFCKSKTYTRKFKLRITEHLHHSKCKPWDDYQVLLLIFWIPVNDTTRNSEHPSRKCINRSLKAFIPSQEFFLRRISWGSHSSIEHFVVKPLTALLGQHHIDNCLRKRTTCKRWTIFL